VGVARGTINAIETGKYDLSLPLAFKIARVFGKNVKEVFLYPEEQDTTLSVYQHGETASGSVGNMSKCCWGLHGVARLRSAGISMSALRTSCPISYNSRRDRHCPKC